MRMLNHKNTKTWHHAFKRSNLQIVILYSNFIFNRNFVLLLFQIVEKGISYLSINFFTNFASRNPKEAGIAAALSGTILFMSIVIPVSFIFGVGTALYLEQYAKESLFKNNRD